MRYLIASVLTVGMLAASPALAQAPGAPGPMGGDWEFTLGGSGMNDRKFDQGQFNIDAEVGQYLTPQWLLSLRQNVTWRGGSGISDELTGGTRLAAGYHFDFDQWRPFVGANIGYVYGDGIRDSFAAGPEAGVKWYLQDRVFLFGRINYDFEFRKAREIDDEFRRGTFVYAVGVGMNF